MARSRSRIITRTRRVSNTSWVASADITAGEVLAAGAAVLDQTFTVAEPHTILRTRGTLWVVSDQTGTSEQPFGALGMCVVSQPAVAIGVTAVPTPQTDAQSDLFFLHQWWASGFTFITGVGIDGNVLSRYDFDSKAMRKINVDESLAVTLENGSAAFGVTFWLQFRLLLKLA